MSLPVNSDVQRILAELEIQVKEMKATKSLQELLPQLEKTRATVDLAHSKASEMKNYQCAFYSLPNESLSAIFEAGLLLIDKCRKRSPAHGLQHPILLSHVSRRFRKVAVQTASLWTNIPVVSLSPELLELYLERSRPCLLEIEMELDIREHEFIRGRKCLLKVTQTEHVIRWGSLRVEALKGWSVDFFVNIFKPFRRLRAPELRSIEVNLYAKHSDLSHDILQLPTPVISSVKMDGVSLHHCLPLLLTADSFEVRDTIRGGRGLEGLTSYDELSVWLSGARSLRNLAVDPSYFRPQQVGSPKVIQLQSLRSIEFCVSRNKQNHSCTTFSTFFDHITTPNVTSLTLTSFPDTIISHLINALSIYPVSSIYPALQFLELYDTSIDAEIFDLASFFPLVTHIKLNHYYGNLYRFMRTLGNLTVDPDPLLSSIIWPDLSSITIGSQVGGKSAGFIDALCDMVEFRSAVGKALLRVTVRSLDLIPEEKLAWLQERVCFEM